MSAKGLSSSRWAPRSSSVPATRQSCFPPPPPISVLPVSTGTGVPDQNPSSGIVSLTISQKEAPRADAELSRYTRIVRRMKWKLPFLAQGYQKATDASSPEAADADMMFKLDFFEYYMLLERALVHLQAVFNIIITGKHPPDRLNGNDTRPYKHRYHANVLEALDSRDNPLHGALGSGDVRRALARAKDLRNRWKNADDSDQKSPATRLPLESYDLEAILLTIYGGLDQACIVATNYVSELKAIAAAAARASATASNAQLSWADEMETPTPGRECAPFETWPAAEEKNEDSEWTFMFDAMDWQAI